MSVTKKSVGSLLLGLFVSSSMACLLTGCNNDAKQPAKVAPIVKTITLGPAAAQPNWSLIGTVSARYQSNLAFRVNGKIEKRLIDAGDSVKEGQVLLTLDPTDFKLAVNITVANVRSTESEIKNAQLELARYKKMLKRNLISQQTIDQSQTQLTTLIERLKAQKIAQEQAANQLQYTRLKSPGLGKILSVNSQEDEVVTAGHTVAIIALKGFREVAVAIPENRLATLPKIAQAQILGSGKTYPVVLRDLSGQADPLSRTWKAHYAFKPSNKTEQKALNSLSLGQTAKLIFITNHSLIKIPNTALYEQADFASVWQVKEGKVLRVPVKVKSLSSRWAWVEGDFSQVKTLVSLGVNWLHEGEAVRESAE